MDTAVNKQLRQAKDELFLPKHDKVHLEEFGKLAQVGFEEFIPSHPLFSLCLQLVDLSLYWKSPLFRACVHDSQGPKTTITPNTSVTYSQFESFWRK